MTIKLARYSRIAVCAAAAYLVPGLSALDPHKSLTQYSRQVWSQQDNGLPEDNIKSITQTSMVTHTAGGTDEGLARFDGIDFTIFKKPDLPANSITSLASSPDGSLWVGTPDGLVQYRGVIPATVGMDFPTTISPRLYSDHVGTLWIVAGWTSAACKGSKFTCSRP